MKSYLTVVETHDAADISMHELSLSMPEPMLSLSMLILATYPEAALDVTLRTHGQN